MNCMKCGSDIEEDQVFCYDCLRDMKKYPIKPGIAIQLPNRKEQPVLKKVLVKRRPVTHEEQLLRLKKRMRILFMLWLVTLALLAATIYPTLEYFFGEPVPQTGQNYSTFSGDGPETRYQSPR